MKTLLVAFSLLLAGANAAHAQVYQPAAVRGSVLGAIAGAFVGGHNHDRWGEGAVIGGIAGALLGSVVDSQQPVYQAAPQVVYSQPVQVYQSAPVVQMAPASCAPTVVQQMQPQVVYVQSAPRVVYVESAPRVVYVAPQPVISFGFGYYSGPRYGYGYSHYRGHR